MWKDHWQPEWWWLFNQHILAMLKESVSHMAPLANTSGPLPLAMMNCLVVLLDALAPLGTVLLKAVFPHLWARSTYMYFCETGLTRYPGINGPFYSNGDPLWDGQGCGSTSSCCTFNSPPWFNVTIPFPTTDNMEVRICSSLSSEDTTH